MASTIISCTNTSDASNKSYIKVRDYKVVNLVKIYNKNARIGSVTEVAYGYNDTINGTPYYIIVSSEGGVSTIKLDNYENTEKSKIE